ncbi:unnamed protein product [Fraxinus pennsylvanica]|uniref:Uncharacterized protein n=1 Tax=Fraxinus pennsylvanica TaxID=56036 RepID=A0AAD2DJ91_9LAMI|nr:unnamed protein product [Fraxinus pennsylvanica]
MSCSIKAGFSVSGSNDTIIKNRPIGYFAVSPSIVNLQFAHSKSKEFMGKPIEFSDQKVVSNWKAKASRHNTLINAQASICISRGLRWWEKTLVPNMIEIHSVQELHRQSSAFSMFMVGLNGSLAHPEFFSGVYESFRENTVF